MSVTRRHFLISSGAAIGLLSGPFSRRVSAATAPYTHDTSAYIGALAAPEPFRSHWRACRGGSWPDYMRDQPVGHANQRLAGLLYTRDAIRHLKAGDINKALLLASARCHYVGDSSCIAHADVWRPRAKDDLLEPGKPGRGVWSFLPKDVQDYWLPFEKSTTLSYDPLLIGPPPLFRQQWDDLPKSGRPRNMHTFFDQTHALLPFPGEYPENVEAFSKHLFENVGIQDTENWSTYDRELYGRWVAENIALTVLDRQRVLSGLDTIRFVDEVKFQAALEAEMANMVASISTYYRYLSVAANTHIAGDPEELFPSVDRMSLLARNRPKIYLSANAPWSLKRACHLLAMEIVRGQHRNAGRWGGQYRERILKETSELFATCDVPENEDPHRVLISWKLPEQELAAVANEAVSETQISFQLGDIEGGSILLRGKDLQSTIHLVDYLLDLMNAPLHGRVPVDVIFTALKREWEGIRLMKELDTLTDEQAATTPARPRNPHLNDEKAWEARIKRLVNPNSQGYSNISGPPIAYSNLMLKQLPLPDGRDLGIG